MSVTRPDLDLLADYLAGVLDEPRQREVRERLAAQPEWAMALAALRDAQEPVRDLLAGIPADPIPAAVAASLERALAIAAGQMANQPAPPSPARLAPSTRRRLPTEATSPAQVAPVIDLTERRRRRRQVLAIAAGVVVFAGVSLAAVTTVLRPQGVASHSNQAGALDSTKADRGTPAAPQAGGAGPAQSGLTAVASGHNYSSTDLASSATALLTTQPAPRSGPPRATVAPLTNPAEIPATLARLAEPQARTVCLALATAGDPGAVQLLDYAGYAGQPALIIVIREAASHRVIAVGADCGQAGAADILAVATATP